MDKTSLGDRMKEYENVERRYLTRRQPLIIRADGRAFHRFTKDFKRPFDESFLACMRSTAKDLCENIMGAKFAYTQSDEISLLLTDDDSIETQAWFGKNLQKIVSVSAAMATFFFNRNLSCLFFHGLPGEDPGGFYFGSMGMNRAYVDKRIAAFDARAFVLPREEVNNYFLWRQRDCECNSIQSVAHANYPQKELIGLSCNDLQNKLFTERGINWNDYPIAFRRGAAIEKDSDNKWFINMEIPRFNEDRAHIENIVYHRGEEK